MKTSYDELTDNERAETYGNERYGLTEPSGHSWTPYGNAHSIHWLGYMLDPGPTEALREQGRAVIVVGDAPHLASNEFVLRPTKYPLPEPWNDVWPVVAEGSQRMMVGGKKNGRFLTNDHLSALVDEDVYQAAKAMGARVLDESDGHHRIARNALAQGAEKIRIDDAGVAVQGIRDSKPWRRLGQACIADCYWRALKMLGVDQVMVTGAPEPGFASTKTAIVGVGVMVMPILADEDEVARAKPIQVGNPPSGTEQGRP